MNTRTLEDLLLSLELANETDTGIELRNIAVLMFSERPDKYIPGAQIDLVKFDSPDAEAGDDFVEKTFTGPIWKKVIDALEYIQTNVILTKVNKIENQEKSETYDNYPYNALEEALVNAVFHKSYRDDTPVEIRIYVDRIMIINFPGPDKWIDMEKFANGKVRARKYRNRRIGELFKEIDLSEKQGTGISKILRELKKNNSPAPIFDTDEDRTYLETTILIREGFESQEMSELMSESMSELISKYMSALESERINKIYNDLSIFDSFNSSDVSRCLVVEMKTASRLLNKAEKIGILESEGNTKTKRYKFKKFNS